MDLVTLGTNIGVVGTALASIWGGIKYIYGPLKKAYTKAVQFYNNCEFLVSEIKPNGGSSLKDSVEGLKRSIDSMLSTVVRLDQRQIAISNHSDKGIFESDINGDCVFVNRAYCRIFDRNSEEALGKGWKTFIHPEDRDGVIEEWNSCVKENRDFVFVYKTLRPDNSVVTVDVHAYVLRDLKGQNIGFMGFVVPAK
jgi:PAS domain S-box-containing protein